MAAAASSGSSGPGRAANRPQASAVMPRPERRVDGHAHQRRAPRAIEQVEQVAAAGRIAVARGVADVEPAGRHRGGGERHEPVAPAAAGGAQHGGGEHGRQRRHAGQRGGGGEPCNQQEAPPAATVLVHGQGDRQQPRGGGQRQAVVVREAGHETVGRDQPRDGRRDHRRPPPAGHQPRGQRADRQHGQGREQGVHHPRQPQPAERMAGLGERLHARPHQRVVERRVVGRVQQPVGRQSGDRTGGRAVGDGRQVAVGHRQRVGDVRGLVVAGERRRRERVRQRQRQGRSGDRQDAGRRHQPLPGAIRRSSRATITNVPASSTAPMMPTGPVSPPGLNSLQKRRSR